MDVIINYIEHEYHDAYVEPVSGSPVYTSYVELNIDNASNPCLEGYKCEEVDLLKDGETYEGTQDLTVVYVVICRFNNIAANIYEDWNLVGCYSSEDEALSVSEDFTLHSDELKGLSDSLILLYCDTHPVPFKKV